MLLILVAYPAFLVASAVKIPESLVRRGVSEVGAVVNTTSGPVTGHAAANASTVSEYLGVPFALPPVGDLRWAAPQPLRSTKSLNASSFGFDCPYSPYPKYHYPGGTPQQVRIIADFAGENGTPQSEDCLTLNIWAKNTVGKKAKAVLLFIHGGKYLVGSTNSPLYNGQYLAEQEDVIVVTINYRLTVFGFPGAPGTLNVALLDQRLAIEWVRDNIAGFGGDPSLITIFGQSVGGASVDYFQYTNLHDPIVAGLISESGTAHSFIPNNQTYSSMAFLNLSRILGCGANAEDDILPCMRQKNFTEILAAVAKIPTAPTAMTPQPVFHPVVDGKLIFENYTNRAAAGKIIRKPYLAGNNDNEAGFYKITALATNLTFPQWKWNLFNLEGFTCATATSTHDIAAAGVPVWRYRYFGQWHNLELYPGSGAYHGSELDLVFGTARDVSGLADSAEEKAVGRVLMRAWAAFARDPEKGLQDLGWPKYDPTGATLVRLAYDNSANATFVSPLQYDCACQELEGDLTYAKGGF